MVTDPAPLESYGELLSSLRQRIRSAQVRAGLAVNRELVLLYWEVGKEILRRQDARAGVLRLLTD